MATEEQSRDGLRKYRLLLIVPFVITAIVLIPLALIQKSALVRIELVVECLSFDFLTSEGGPLFSSIYIKEAQLTHFDKISLPFARANITTGFDENASRSFENENNQSDGNLIVVPEDDYSSIFFDNIMLSELNIKKHAKVTLSFQEEEGGGLKVVIDGDTTKGKIICGDSLYIECQHCEIVHLTEKIRNDLQKIYVYNQNFQTIDFRSKDQLIIMSLQLDNLQNLDERNIYIENISFFKRYERHMQTGLLKPAKIIFKDLDKEEIIIESHEFIEITPSENLEILQMAVGQEGIELVISGKVNKLRTGTKDFMSSRLPSILEWIYLRRPLILYLNTVVLIATTVIAVMQRLKLISK
jgi:hypothetical protein